MKNIRELIRDWLLQDLQQGQTVTTTRERIVKTKPQGTVIEADDVAERWKPKQHGNVIIAEPDIMKEFRRNHGQM